MYFDPLNFISEKKAGRKHRPRDIAIFIDGMVSGEIPDYQVSAWLMAVCFQGLSFRETLALTYAMTDSGNVYEWDNDGPPVADKHSTGGVGDTVTLIVVPLAAAMGMRMGKHSGRGLGHTGGTIDKLESIPGFVTSLTEKKFRSIVNRIGCAVAGQDESMTPADGILYTLRDVTATVSQEALIASSIMSKKLAGGAGAILIDIKVGSGAFMKDPDSAKSLADLMIKIGRASGKKIRTLVSPMDAPLGRSVGNALEIAEAIRILKNEAPDTDPLINTSIEIAARLASICGLGKIQHTRSRAKMLISSGAALSRFRDMIRLQGGNPEVVDNPLEILPRSKGILKLKSPRNGFVKSCDAFEIGELVRDLGGGRKTKGDTIDPSVGIVLYKRPGDPIVKGDTLCEIHTNGAIGNTEALERAAYAFKFSSKRKTAP